MTASSSLSPGAASAAPTPEDHDRPAYPPTRIDPVKTILHGVEIADPYRWLEDGASPEVQEWMRDQDAFTRAELARLPERDAIASRLKQLFYVDAVSAPRHRRGRYFVSRRHATKEKSIVYWKQGKSGEERPLLDPNSWSADGSLSLGGWHVSWDGKNVAYKVQKNNSDEATLHVMDVATGKRSEADVIEGAKYAYASWTPSGDGFYYVWLPTDPSIPAADRPGYAEVRFHRLGEDPAKDRIVRGRTGDPRTFLGASLSKDGRFLVLTVSHGWTSMDVYFRDLRKPGGEARDTPLAVGSDAHYLVEVYKDRFYVHTDEGAPHGRVFEVDPDRPERAAWKEIVPERPDATLESVSIVGGHLALSYLKDASSRVEIRALDGKLVRELPLPGIGTVGGPIGLPDEDDAYFSFDSFTSPQEIYATSIRTGKTELYARVEVPVDPSPYVVEQAFFPSKDGTRISMFIVRRKDMEKDGSARALLYGYGGFQISQTPSFIASMYPWLERGGVYAVANLRGGGEYGEAWHRDGMLLKKQNVFDDFIAAAEHLVREGYTRPERLAIQGGSNGGLLVGAALTQRPELFGAVLCGVPLLDMVRYHLFGSGKTWISEYGSSDDPEQFKALHAYSPYHRIEAGTRYPAILLLSADSDDRVDPMHARKFAAALQAASAGGPVLLRIERNAGHGGADLVKAAVEKGADQLAFALAATGARQPAAASPQQPAAASPQQPAATGAQQPRSR
ncbi:prolyl oligopeptidase family serine peptidase [Sorangium sp. So ce1036]|uniref:prolyl oligopeptidase family serine peptidase n=1 Tax=Sorangium sp. So ce1036 TaxID=3133328 RepID=UPI003EFE86B3